MKLENSPSPQANGVAYGPPHRPITKSGPPTQAKAAPANWQIIMIPVGQIGPNPYQPRLQFDEDEMAELIASVRERGVQQPILVRTAPKTDGDDKGKSYQLVAGERRLRACKAAKRRSIPAILRDDLSDVQAAELALLENVQRSNLNIIEEARAFRRLMLDFRMKEERIAKKVGKSVATVKDTLRLLALPGEVQTLLIARKLTASHGQQLLRLAPFEAVCREVARRAATESIPATTLSQELLPGARQLRDSKLIVELDFRTRFDWKSECGSCPHKAYVVSGYHSYCLKPDEWQRKQNEAIERAKQEAARVLDEAKQSESGEVDTESLPPGSYRDLTHAQLPAGCCEVCPCRGETTDPRDPTQKKSICLAPERFAELVRAERQAHEEARQRKFTEFWREALRRLNDAQKEPIVSWTTLALWPLVKGTHLRYGEQQSWNELGQQVATELSLDLPWQLWQDEETSTAQLLTELKRVETNDLLRFFGALLLAQEALQAIRYGGETPLLSAVLGHQTATQGEFSDSDGTESSDSDSDEEE